MRSELGKTTAELAEQKRLLSSSEDFAKQIFSSRVEVAYGFTPPFPPEGGLTSPTMASPNYAILPPPNGKGTTIVYLLLPSAPIQNTVQLTYFVSLQPSGSYSLIHNLLIFYWGDPPENLKQRALTASYFPDKGDTELIKALSVKQGRIFADDQPLPKINQPDGDFKGNKWITVETGTQAPSPVSEKK